MKMQFLRLFHENAEWKRLCASSKCKEEVTFFGFCGSLHSGTGHEDEDSWKFGGELEGTEGKVGRWNKRSLFKGKKRDWECEQDLTNSWPGSSYIFRQITQTFLFGPTQFANFSLPKPTFCESHRHPTLCGEEEVDPQKWRRRRSNSRKWAGGGKVCLTSMAKRTRKKVV